MLLGLDFDGTLAESRNAVHSSLFHVASTDSQESITRLQRVLESISGKLLEEQIRSFIVNLELDNARQIFMDYYQKFGVKKTVLNRGAKDLLEYCSRCGIRIVVISAKSDTNLALSMKHLDLEKIPSYGNCGTLDKTRILKDLNVDIYVGDHPNDILAAKNADVTSVFLKSTSSIQSINESDFEISDLRQMINILKFFQNSIF